MPGVKMVSSGAGQQASDAVQMCSWAATVKVISIVITLFDFSSISCLLLSTLLLILDRLQPRNALGAGETRGRKGEKERERVSFQTSFVGRAGVQFFFIFLFFW